jgi:hypothetical protein
VNDSILAIGAEFASDCAGEFEVLFALSCGEFDEDGIVFGLEDISKVVEDVLGANFVIVAFWGSGESEAQADIAGEARFSLFRTEVMHFIADN